MIFDGMDFVVILLLASPIILIEFGFKIYAVIDIFKQDRRVRHLSKTAWAVIVLLISFSWIVYLLIGREDVVIED